MDWVCLYGGRLGAVIFAGKAGSDRRHDTDRHCLLAMFAGRPAVAWLCPLPRAPDGHDSPGDQALHYNCITRHRDPQRLFLLCRIASASRCSGDYCDAGADPDLWSGITAALGNFFSKAINRHYVWGGCDHFACWPGKQPARSRFFDLGIAGLFWLPLLCH